MQQVGGLPGPTPAEEALASTQLMAEPGAATAEASGGGQAGAAPALGVPMQDMIDSIRATIEVAARQGLARAHIQLQPEELGHISIRLSQTGEGLRARVSADTPAGTQALTQGRSELRQALTSLGLSLLQLDIGSSGYSQAGAGGEHFAGRSEGSAALAASALSEGDEETEDPSAASRPQGAALGEIVDVLA